MIWICTISLLFVASWLFFNALNERRWVQAHIHDESVASDEGLLPSFTMRTGTGAVDGDGKVSIDQENSRFARAVAKVQEKTSKLGDKYFESKVAAARLSDPENPPRSVREEDTFFGRAVANIGEKTARMDEKLEAKMKQASSQFSRSTDGTNQDESTFARASRLVAEKSDELSQRIARGAKNIASIREEDRAAEAQSGLFGKMVDRVSGSLDKFESKIDEKVARSKKPSADKEGDLMSRVASKVGEKVSEMDEKFVSASKSVVNKLDKS